MCHAVALIPGLSRTYSFLGLDTQQMESGTGTFLWFAVGILKLYTSFCWIVRVQGLVCPLGVLWEIWATFQNPKIHRGIKGAEQGHKSNTVMEAMEGLHNTSNYATTQVLPWLMLLTTFLGCTSQLLGWQEQSEQLQVLRIVRGDQAELVPLKTTSGWMEPHLVCRERGWAGMWPLATLGCLSLSRFQYHSILGRPHFHIGFLQMMPYPILRSCKLQPWYFDFRS